MEDIELSKKSRLAGISSPQQEQLERLPDLMSISLELLFDGLIPSRPLTVFGGPRCRGSAAHAQRETNKSTLVRIMVFAAEMEIYLANIFPSGCYCERAVSNLVCLGISVVDISSSLQNASEEFEETDTFETQDDPRVMLSESMERTFYGLLGKPLALEVVNLLKVEKCLEMPNELPPPPTGLTQNHRESLLSPPVMRDLKIPSTKGFTGSSGDFKEKPLYDHALTLRKILISLTAIYVIAKNPEAFSADFSL